MRLFVIHAHALVGGIPNLAISALQDVVHAIVDERLRIQVLMLHKFKRMLHRHRQVNAARIRPHPKVAPFVSAQGIDAIAL